MENQLDNFQNVLGQYLDSAVEKIKVYFNIVVKSYISFYTASSTCRFLLLLGADILVLWNARRYLPFTANHHFRLVNTYLNNNRYYDPSDHI